MAGQPVADFKKIATKAELIRNFLNKVAQTEALNPAWLDSL
jgi:hypothetical protein